MATTEIQIPRRSQELVERSILHTIIPQSSSFTIEDVLQEIGLSERKTHDPQSSSIKQRTLVFFDESLSIFLLLQTPYQPEDELQEYISRLAITLEVHIIGTAPYSQAQRQNEDTDPIAVKELLTTCTVENTEDPLIAVREPDNVSEGQVALAWNLKIPLVRPRARLQNPFLAFTAHANLKQPEDIKSKTRVADYLPSLMPTGINILQPLNNDPTLKDIKPRLSSLRVSRVAPANPSTKKLQRPLKNDSKHLLPIGPATSTRVRFLPPSNIGGQSSMICSLDFTVSPLVGSIVSLNQVDLKLEGGIVEVLAGPEQLGELPMSCKPRDEITYLYRLKSSHVEDVSPIQTSSIQSLEVTTACDLGLPDGCIPRITTKWKTNVDFSIPVELPAGGSERPGVRRNIPSGTPLTVRPESPSFKPDSLPVMESPTLSTEVGLKTVIGVTVTITGPETVYTGQEFWWQILVLNRSKKQKRLGLVVIPRRRRVEAKKLPTRPSSVGGSRKHEDIADPIIDENIIHAMQKSALIEPTELVCLSSDTRIGPLLPNACHSSILRFLPFATGVLHVEALRIVDLSTQESIDIRALPVVFCTEPKPKKSS